MAPINDRDRLLAGGTTTYDKDKYLGRIHGKTQFTLVNNTLNAPDINATTITGSTVTGSTATFGTVTGSTITGSTALFGTVTGSTVTGSTALFGTITGSTVTGSTALFGVITGSTVTGSTALFGTVTGSTVTGSTAIFGVITGSTVTGSTAKFTTVTGSTTTGSTAIFGTVTGSTVTGSTAIFGTVTGSTVTGSTATFTTVTGSTVTGSTALFGTITGSTITANTIQLNTGVTYYDPAVGEVIWDDANGTYTLGLKGGNIHLALGEREVQIVRNVDSADFTIGQIVNVTGSSGQRVAVKRAIANSDITSATVLGMVSEAINQNQTGFVTISGLVTGVNTNSFNEGDVLWLSATVSGSFTNVKPTAPDHGVMVGYVVKKNINGSVYVHMQNGYEISELHDVYINGKANGDILQYVSANNRWQNVASGSITVGTASYAVTASVTTGSAGGDLTGSYPSPTLAAITTSGTSGSASVVPVVTIDTKGRVMTLSSAAIAITTSSVSGLGTAAGLNYDTSTTLGTSDTKLPTQNAVKTYVDNAVTGLLDFKGSTDCSLNPTYPNYPAASKGDAYIVSVAGKIGGASGTSVDIGDVYFAIADNAGGTQAAVGSSWDILEHNLVGALLSANNLSDLTSASTARTNLGLGSAATASVGDFATAAQGTLADGALQKSSNLSDLVTVSTARTNLGLGTVAVLTSSIDGTLAGNSDLNVPTEKAVKTYADTKIAKSGDTMTGALTMSSGASLVLTGGASSGQGNIQMGAAASNTYDSNILYVDSNTRTMGSICSSTPIAAATYGSYFLLRGNTYSAIASQRGNLYIAAGNPTSPSASEGTVRISTGADVTRLLVDNSGKFAINNSSVGNGLVNIAGSYTSTSLIDSVLYATTNITAQTNGDAYGITSNPTLTKASSGTHAYFLGMYAQVPTIATPGGSTATVTNAATLFVGGGTTGATNNHALWVAGGVSRIEGKLGLGIAPGSTNAVLHIKAGTATANTAPLKFTSGTNLTTAEAGAMEYDGTFLYFSPVATRKIVTYRKNVVSVSSAQTASVDSFIAANTSGGSFTITLANPSTVGNGAEITIKKISSDANTLTISASAGSIDGTSTKTITTQYSVYRFVSDGSSNWWLG